MEAEADRNRLIDAVHLRLVQPPHTFAQAAFVYRAYLFEKYHRVFRQPHRFRIYVYMSGELRFAYLARDCGGYDSRTVTVADVVLNDQHRPEPPLFASDYGTEIGIINISAFDVQNFSHSLFYELGRFLPFVFIFPLRYNVLIKEISSKFVNVFNYPEERAVLRLFFYHIICAERF